MNIKKILLAVFVGLTIGTLTGIAGASEKVIDIPQMVIVVTPKPKPAPRLVCGQKMDSLDGGSYRVCEWVK